ncbi:MAG: hypothetical protein IJE08_14205 [Clostridia bacterium]|nr:hypothetical protein [Clostridia bacterium]
MDRKGEGGMPGTNELALQARYSPEAMERLKHQYQPLIAARVMLHIGFRRPEYIEAGREAVEEAVMSFAPEKGSFTTHLRQVLKFRLIDLRRKERVDKVVPVSSLSEEHRARAVGEASLSAHREEEEILRRREEIELFRSDLLSLGLSLNDVAAASPKHAETRRVCRRACRMMRVNPDLMAKAARGRVPVNELSALLDVSPKTIERHRKYLVACAVALAGDYQCILYYIFSGEGAE